MEGMSLTVESEKSPLSQESQHSVGPASENLHGEKRFNVQQHMLENTAD